MKLTTHLRKQWRSMPPRIARRLFAPLLVLLVAVGLMTAAASSAMANDGDSIQVDITATSYADSAANMHVNNVVQALVHGATQLLWEQSHQQHVSHNTIANAPRVHTKCSPNNSAQIFHQTHGAKYVIVTKGSCLNNEGLLGHIVGGFKFHLKHDIVLKYDSKIDKYRHAFTIIHGKLKQACGNIIGGRVQQWFKHVKQVKSKEDLLLQGDAYSDAGTTENLALNVTCPSGAAFSLNLGVTGKGVSDASLVQFTQLTLNQVLAGRQDLAGSAISNAHVDADSHTSSTITTAVSVKCGSKQPVVVNNQPPSIGVVPRGCIDQGSQDGTLDFTVFNNDDVVRDVYVTVAGKEQNATVQVPAHGQATGSLYAFFEGSYTVTATVLDTGLTSNASTQINACQVSPPQHSNPIGELFVGEHAVDQGGTMPVFGRVLASDGATATLASPTVNPSDLGGVYNWQQVSTERDGVTPCATGYVCYQGYFRVTKAGSPGTTVYGTLASTARDNQGGSSATDPVQFAVEYADHPNT